MTCSAWFCDPVPVNMGSDVYFVIVTTGRLRFIAWVEGGAFVTRIGEHLHVFDNVACWMPLPKLPNNCIRDIEGEKGGGGE